MTTQKRSSFGVTVQFQGDPPTAEEKRTIEQLLSNANPNWMSGNRMSFEQPVPQETAQILEQLATRVQLESIVTPNGQTLSAGSSGQGAGLSSGSTSSSRSQSPTEPYTPQAGKSSSHPDDMSAAEASQNAGFIAKAKQKVDKIVG